MKRLALALVFVVAQPGCDMLFDEEVAETAVATDTPAGGGNREASQDLDALIESLWLAILVEIRPFCHYSINSFWN